MSPKTIARIAREAGSTPETVRRFFNGAWVKLGTEAAIRDAARRLGIPVPQ